MGVVGAGGVAAGGTSLVGSLSGRQTAASALSSDFSSGTSEFS